MAIDQTTIDTLNTAISYGERRVKFSNGTEVEYRSVEELIQARNDLVNQKHAEEAAAAGTPRPRQTQLYHGGRGFHS